MQFNPPLPKKTTFTRLLRQEELNLGGRNDFIAFLLDLKTNKSVTN